MKPTPSVSFDALPSDLAITTWTYTVRADRATHQCDRIDWGHDRDAARAHVERQLSMNGTAKVHVLAQGRRADGTWPYVRIDCYPDGHVSTPRFRDAACHKGARRFLDADVDAAFVLDRAA